VENAQMLKGLLPLVSLAVLEDGDGYGYEIVTRLRAAGLDTVGDASVYGTLQRLYESGFLSSYMVTSEVGPARRYFSLTAAGAAELKLGREVWQHFQSVVSGLLNPGQAGVL
jgi:PadR family transcriptional regulator PadR